MDLKLKSIKASLLVVALLNISTMFGQSMETLKVWPNEPSKAEAEIYVYHPAESSQACPAILLCPGGGYEELQMRHEGHDMAKWYAENGVMGVVLKYRMPHGVHSIPLSDAEKAMKIIRDHGKEWNVDINKVGVFGASAGGHLAASMCTIVPQQSRANFAVLYYPVISFDDKITNKGTKNNLLGKDVNNASLVEHYTLNKQVDAYTPTTLLMLSANDDIVLPINSIEYYKALSDHKIPAAMYMFPEGRHGWGIMDSFSYAEEVKTLVLKWLKFSGILADQNK